MRILFHVCSSCSAVASIVALFLSLVASHGQGTGVGIVNFNTTGAADPNRVWVGSAVGQGVRASGPTYQVALYWAPEGTCDEAKLRQVGGSTSFLTGGAAGTFFGSGRTITGLPQNGAIVDLQARAWKRNVGTNVFDTYEAALLSGEPGVEVGKGPIFSLKLREPSHPSKVTPSVGGAAGWRGFTIRPPNGPDISMHPCDQTISFGDDASFSVIAAGLGDLFYRWSFNGTNLLGETNSVLVIKTVHPDHQGLYQAVVTNAFGVATTRSAMLTVGARGVSITVAEGWGMVAKSPDKIHYETNELVSLTAIPGRWHRSDRWGDGVTDNPRLITIMPGFNAYSVYFSPTTALETVTINGISRLAPVGMPSILMDGQFITNVVATNYGGADISVQTTLPNGVLFWTLNGTRPDILTSPLYTGPREIKRAVTVWAVAYSADFSQRIEGDPVQIDFVPLYHLLASAPGGGHIQINPELTAFPSNSVVTVSALPDPGWTFLGWLGGLTGTNEIETITMTRDQCIRAIFGTTLGTTISGSGTVTVSPDVEWYPFGTEVQFFATPEPGHSFALWSSGGVSTNNPLQFSVTTPEPTIAAAFQPLSQGQFALAVTVEGFGEVLQSPRLNRYTSRQNVTLTAVAAPFQAFLAWSGDATGNQNPIIVSMSQSRIVTAHFTQAPLITPEPCGILALEGMRFSLRGRLGSAYLIERSTNLHDWTPMLILTNVLGSSEWYAESLGLPSEFFRAATSF